MTASSFNMPNLCGYTRRETTYNGVDGTISSVVDFTSKPTGSISNVSKTDSTRRRKPIGWLYPLPYIMDKSLFHEATGTNRIEVSNKGGGRLRYLEEYSGIFGADALSVASSTQYTLTPTASMKARAEIKALGKLKNQKVNFGVALAESQQLANLVGTNAAHIARMYSALRKGNLSELARIIRLTAPKSHRGVRNSKIPQNWLELQYAWKPLLSDVHGAVSLLKTRDRVSDRVVTVKASVSQKEKSSIDSLDRGIWPYREKREAEAGVFVRLDYLAASDVLSKVSSLGLTNPLEIAWEVVPYSFVVDWFLPVGNWLGVLDATMGYNFLSGSYTNRKSVRSTFSGIPREYDDINYHRSCSPRWQASGERKNISRAVYTSSPIPALRFKSPLSLGHMANGLSLLAMAFGKGKTSRTWS